MRRSHLAWALPLLAALALFLHARRFDFICDDAFIALRYAKNLSSIGAAVYNPGERVEGYTSFLWMLLAAFGYRVGLGPAAIVTALGALSALVVMAGAGHQWARFSALPRIAAAVPLALIALTAPIAVWTLGGLETCLYAGLLLLSCALGATVAGNGGPRNAAWAALCLALATLTRPEGALAFAIIAGVTALFQVRRPGGLRTMASLAGTYLAIVGPYLLWRRLYYGDFLPNTFYLKTSGDAAALHDHGLAYLRVAARDLGWTAFFMAFPVLLPAPARLPDETDDAARTRRASLWMLRLNLLAMLPYIVRVGGDFLGGYRFLVPLFPLAIVLGAAAAFQWGIVIKREYFKEIWANDPRNSRLARAAAVTLLLVAYALKQRDVARTIETGSVMVSPPVRLEPLEWTRHYALRWAALGRWIKDHAREGDSMAGGAAGAAPYYADITSIDTLGLCDAYVARHGLVVGSRPGHQRVAPLGYLLERAPTFLFYSDAFLTERPVTPRRDPAWEQRGYVWVEARIDPERYGSPDAYYFHFTMRKERADQLRADPYAAVAP